MKMNKKGIQVFLKGYKSFKNIMLELLYPNTCILCGNISIRGICQICNKEYPINLENRCMCCSKIMKDCENEYCQDCIKVEKHFIQGGSLWLHKGKVQESIYRFKYKNHRIYGETFAQLILGTYGEKLKEWKPQAILGVPVHRARRKVRGYNQAEILSIELSREIKIKYGVHMDDITKCLYRNKKTIVQKKLDNKDRVKNIQGAFGIRGEVVLPKKVLIIDDIYTTGATINEIAKLLKKNGVNEVYFLTISIGQGF